MNNEQLQEHFGIDAAEWLSRWDAGKTVWTVEMGGLGPGYEQAIQITVAEFLRIMIAENYDHQTWGDKDVWAKDRDAINDEGHKNETIKGLGLSGAQAGAALSVATQFYMRDPWVALSDSQVKDRLIQVEKTFPNG